MTDNGGKTATAALPVTVNSGGVSNYGDAVLDTAGLQHYWRLGESSGSVFADSKGTAVANATGGFTRGVPGGPAFDPNTAVRFDGSTASARSDFSLAGTNKLTIEFWANWKAYNNDDSLAFEYTPNFNEQRRRVPDRPGRAPDRRRLRGRARPRGQPQQRLLHPARRGHLAPLRDRARHLRAGGPADHALHGRRAGALHEDRERHGRRELRRLEPLLHVARRAAACSATATSTRWRSTTAR